MRRGSKVRRAISRLAGKLLVMFSRRRTYRVILANTEPTLNGHVYSDECLRHMASEINAANLRHGVVSSLNRDSWQWTDTKDLAFRVDHADVDGRALVADVTPFNTPGGDAVRKLMAIGVARFRPSGVIKKDTLRTELVSATKEGHIVTRNVRVIEDFELRSVSMIHRDDDAATGLD